MACKIFASSLGLAIAVICLGLMTDANEAACPLSEPKCAGKQTENACGVCHASCATCFRSGTGVENTECGPLHCITCKPGLTLVESGSHGAFCEVPLETQLASVPLEKRGKIFVINLERRPDRLEMIKNELHRVGAWPTSNTSHIWTEVQITAAVDGKEEGKVRNLMATKNFSLYGGVTAWDQVSGRSFTAGEIGCALSHVAVWQKVLDQNLPFGVVIEDDAHFRPEMLSRATSAIAKYLLTGKYDFLYLGRSVAERERKETVIDAELSLVEPDFSWWTIAYVITAEGARKALQSNRFVQNLLVIDEFLPAIIKSTDYTNSTQIRRATRARFADLEPLNALAFQIGHELVDAQWDWMVQGTENYNSDVTCAEPFLRVQDIEESVYSTTMSTIWDTGRLLPRETAVTLARAGPTDQLRLVVVTVATEATPGYQRFIKTCLRFGIPVRTFGMGVKWEGGDMLGPGGGQKVNILREGLMSLALELQGEQYCDAEKKCSGPDSEAHKQILANTLVVFTDSYDAVVAGSPGDIVRRFLNFNVDIVFSAELFCWPYPKYASIYPTATSSDPYKFLNSGGFMGKLDALLQLFEVGGPIHNRDDDQGYYTDAYLKAAKEDVGFSVTLDTTAEIFQTLHGITKEEYGLNRYSSLFQNLVTGSNPIFIHGNGPWYVKTHLNWLSNYLSWLYLHTLGDHPGRSLHGKVLTKPGKQIVPEETTSCPLLFVSIVVSTVVSPAQWVAFIDGILLQDYPRHCVMIRVTSFLEDNDVLEDLVLPRLRGFSMQEPFLHIELIRSHFHLISAHSRALAASINADSETFLFLEPSVILTHPAAFRTLVYDNPPGLTTVAMQADPAPASSDDETTPPALPDSTFYTLTDEHGIRVDTADYSAILARQLPTGHDFLTGLSAYPFKTVLNIACVRHIFTIPRDYQHDLLDVVISLDSKPGVQANSTMMQEALCAQLRHKALFMYVNNMEDWGFLVPLE